MSMYQILTIFLCLVNIINSEPEQIYDIEDIKDDGVRDKFDDFPLVSEEKRPSTICPVGISSRSSISGQYTDIALFRMPQKFLK